MWGTVVVRCQNRSSGTVPRGDPSQISCRGTKLASLVSGNEALGSGACSRWGVLELLVAY